jgi:hypothetical protein
VILFSKLQRQIFFKVRSYPTIPINDLPANFPNKEEGILRCKLASLYRLVDRYGLTYGIYNHISVTANL